MEQPEDEDKNWQLPPRGAPHCCTFKISQNPGLFEIKAKSCDIINVS